MTPPVLIATEGVVLVRYAGPTHANSTANNPTGASWRGFGAIVKLLGQAHG